MPRAPRDYTRRGGTLSCMLRSTVSRNHRHREVYGGLSKCRIDKARYDLLPPRIPHHLLSLTANSLQDFCPLLQFFGIDIVNKTELQIDPPQLRRSRDPLANGTQLGGAETSQPAFAAAGVPASGRRRRLGVWIEAYATD
jgi:hypothetical protein